MANKLDKDAMSDLVSQDTIEDFEKAQKIVLLIGQTYPNLSIDLLARITMLCALQYDMSERNMEQYIECLEQYMKASYIVKETLDVPNNTNETIH